jgi:SAM-dependent methyltransferase
MSASPAQLEAIWHDVECGAYAADLPTWIEIATSAAGPVLELGCGTGRVALHLAEAGLDVVALDSEPALLDGLAERARTRGLEIQTVLGDARALAQLDRLDREFAAVLAPMQLVHVVGGEEGRKALLDGAAARLPSGGVLAAAVLDEDALAVASRPDLPLLPDVREVGGWVYSSQPLDVVALGGDGIEIRRLRQTVSPAGELRDEPHSIRLDALTAGRFEAEAKAAGLHPQQRIEIAATNDHVGSTICVLEAG